MEQMTRPLIAVDIGNSHIKVGVFDGVDCTGLPLPIQTFGQPLTELDFASLRNVLPTDPCPWFVVSVQRQVEQQLAAYVLKNQIASRYHLISNHELPIRIQVEKPDLVGTDRVIAACGVNLLRDCDRPAIVIDAGSAATVDFISVTGEFCGGAILPGKQMIANALYEKTDLLPYVELSQMDSAPESIGTSSVSAIYSGLHWGFVGGIRELVSRMQSQASVCPQIFISGGDAPILSQEIEGDTFIVPELVLSAINAEMTRRTLTSSAAQR